MSVLPYCNMPTPSYQIHCTRNERIANGIYEITFEKPAGFDFIPGQFILLDVPLIENPYDIQTRSYSLASAPSEDELLLVLKMKEGGRASRWVEETLKPGDIVRMQGPTGRFQLDRETNKDWLMICTSTGIAPFRSQLVAFLSEETRRIDLIFGVRSVEDLFWSNWLNDLARKHENLSVYITLTNPSENWQGLHGRVQSIVPNICTDFSRTQLYVCGNPEMTKEIKTMALEVWGVAKDDFHMEGYI